MSESIATSGCSSFEAAFCSQVTTAASDWLKTHRHDGIITITFA